MTLFFLIILTISFCAGQVISWDLGNGVRLIPLDLVVVLFGLGNLFRLTVEQKQKYLQIFGWFLAIGVFSLVWQVGKLAIWQIALSGLYLVRFGFYSLLFIIFSQANFAKWGKRLLLINGLGLATLGLFQLFLYPNLRNLSYLGWDPHQYRLFSTLLDPNFMGIILVLTLFVGFDLWQSGQLRKIINPAIIWLLLGKTFLALLLTYSRGSFIAFLAGIFVVLRLKRNSRLIGAVIGLFFIILFLLPKPGGEGVNILRTISVAARWKNNLEAISLWRQSPVIGYGFNTLRFVRYAAFTDDLTRLQAGFHNSWLFLLATTGISGFFVYLDIWQRLIKAKFKGKIFGNKQIYVWASLTAVGVHSLFDNSLFYPWVMYWLFILLGSGEN